MADYLVLEEDGTSHLELEESTSDFLLEDGLFVYTKTGSGFVGATSSGAAPASPGTTYATWKVGTITVPSSPGSVSVNGMTGTPKAVIFHGVNFTDVDTVLTNTGNAIFRGMAGPDYSSPGDIVQNAAAVGPTGDQHLEDNYAILNLTTAGNATVLYRATLDSLDADGFTVTFDVAASGGYKVIYAALIDVDNTGAFVGSVAQSALALGWTAEASLMHCAWAGPVVSGSDRTQESFGGADYGNNEAVGANALCFPTSFQGQYFNGVQQSAANVSVMTAGSFIGPFLTTTNVQSGVSGTNLSFTGAGSSGGMILAWDDPDTNIGLLDLSDTASGTAAVTGLTYAPGLVLGYSCSNEPAGQGTGANGALGFSVITPDFQWSALLEIQHPGYPSFGTGLGSIQSFTNGVVSAIDDTAYHAATVALTQDGFVATTTVDDIPSGTWGWQVFGHPERLFSWIPQIVRYV